MDIKKCIEEGTFTPFDGDYADRMGSSRIRHVSPLMKMTNKQKLKCLFGHHEWEQVADLRRCIYCKRKELATWPKKDMVWVDALEGLWYDFVVNYDSRGDSEKYTNPNLWNVIFDELKKEYKNGDKSQGI